MIKIFIKKFVIIFYNLQNIIFGRLHNDSHQEEFRFRQTEKLEYNKHSRNFFK